MSFPLTCPVCGLNKGRPNVHAKCSRILQAKRMQMAEKKQRARPLTEQQISWYAHLDK